MSDLIRKSEPDRSRINLEDEAEVKSWTKHFGVGKEELARAVDKVGNSAAAVRKELGQGTGGESRADVPASGDKT